MRSKKSFWVLVLTPIIVAGLALFMRWAHVPHFDEPPFILLNLVLSFQAAYTGPMVLMSERRRSEQDREEAQEAYATVQDLVKRVEEQSVLLRMLLEERGLEGNPEDLKSH